MAIEKIKLHHAFTQYRQGSSTHAYRMTAEGHERGNVAAIQLYERVLGYIRKYPYVVGATRLCVANG